MPFSISGASGQLTLCLQRENKNLLEIKTHFAHRKADICATQTSLWVSALLSHLFPFFMPYIPQPPYPVTPLWFGRGSQHVCVNAAAHISRNHVAAIYMFPAENRVKWACVGISSFYSKTSSCKLAWLSSLHTVEIYVEHAVFRDNALWCKDSWLIRAISHTSSHPKFTTAAILSDTSGWYKLSWWRLWINRHLPCLDPKDFQIFLIQQEFHARAVYVIA